MRTLQVQVDDAASRLRLESIAGVDWVDERVGLIQADGPVPDFVAQMVTAGVRLRSVGPTATALEDLYLRLSKDSVA